MATGFARNYRADPFFRTEINIILLQVVFSLAVLGLIGAALALLYQASLTFILAQVQVGIADFSNVAGSQIVPVSSFTDVQSGSLMLIMAAGVGIMVVFGYLMIRVALAPTRNALTSQKRFVGNVAHELRTPLSILRTNNDLRLMDSSLEPKVKAVLESNTEELERLSEIINNLLTLNTMVRPENLDFGATDLASVTEHMAEKLSLLATKKGVAVSVRRNGATSVWGNRTALEQVAMNILKNAILYTPEGGTIAASVEPSDDQRMVTLRVRDSGVGITEKELFHIFEPFYRTDPARARKTGGSGLGLTIVSELVRLHRGTVRVRSAPGRGTTVLVSIPATEQNRKAAALGERSGRKRIGDEVTVDFSKRVF